MAFVCALRRRSDGRLLPWGLSSLCILATLALLPVYFGQANTRMVNEAIEASQIGAELESWSRWRWLPKAPAASAVALGDWGLRREQAERAPKRSIRWQREGASGVGRRAVEGHAARTSPPARVNDRLTNEEAHDAQEIRRGTTAARRKGGATEAGAAFLAFVFMHAGCGDGAYEFRLDERSLACWCQRCDELRVFAAGDHGA